MAIPLTGALSASMINVELGRSATASFSLKDAETGVYGAINTCSAYHPNGSAPYSMSEWYGYDHNAPCLNSNFAFFDDINTGTEDMLYSLNKNYWTVVSSTRPNPASKMTVSFWMKMVNPGGVNRAGLMELSPITPGSSTQSLRMEWDLAANALSPGTYDASVIFLFTDSSGNSVTSKANLADANNSLISGINPNAYWDVGNTGYVDANGYSLITIVIDYAAIGTSTYAEWYWNDSLLTVPWQSAPANGSSFTDGSTFNAPNWTNNRLYVGGTDTISAECQLDGFAIFLQTDLTQTDVSAIYNGGAVASIGTYTGISSALLFYNFESNTPNIGLDTGGTYSMNLEERNTPFRVQDPAV